MQIANFWTPGVLISYHTQHVNQTSPHSSVWFSAVWVDEVQIASQLGWMLLVARFGNVCYKLPLSCNKGASML